MTATRIMHSIEFELEPLQLNNINFALSGKLFCPPPSPANIHIEEIHQANLTWLHTNGLLTDKSSQRFAAIKLENIIGSTIANLKPEEMKIIINLISTFVLFDDMAEKILLDKNNLPKLKSAMDNINNIFNSKLLTVNHISEPASPFTAFYRAFFDLFKRIHLHYKDTHYFTKSIENFFHGLLMMQCLRENNTMSIQTFLTARKCIYGMTIAYELICLMMQFNIDANTRSNPIFILTTEKALNLLLLLNDMVSLPNEIKSNCLDNYILVKASHSKTKDLKKVFAHTIKLFNDELVDFLSMRNLITDETTNIYYQSILIPSVRDAIDWSFSHTKRYGKIIATFKQEAVTNQAKSNLATLSFLASNQPNLLKPNTEQHQLTLAEKRDFI